MKHNKLIAALATAGALVAMNSAHAIVPAAAAGIAALAGAAVGSAAAQANPPPPPVTVVQPPAVAVVPDNSTVVMGGPPVIHEVVPAPQEGYRWERGHYDVQNGGSAWIPGHWVPNPVIIYQSN